MQIVRKTRSFLLRVSGYLIPLIQQIPTLGVYIGLMTLPVIVYLVLLFSQLPVSIIEVIPNFLSLASLSPLGALVTNLMIVVGLLFVLYSSIHLQRRKKDGLVMTGPYRYVRHPQYTGLLLLTLGLTSWSYWILSVTRGIGWLTREGTIVLWYAILFAYIVLALVEESYLSKEFGTDYATYKRNVPFFIPYVKTKRFDIPLSILILSLILFGDIQLFFSLSVIKF